MFLSFLQQLCVTMAGHGVSKWLKKVYIFLTKTVAILENSGADVPEYQESLLKEMSTDSQYYYFFEI